MKKLSLTGIFSFLRESKEKAIKIIQNSEGLYAKRGWEGIAFKSKADDLSLILDSDIGDKDKPTAVKYIIQADEDGNFSRGDIKNLIYKIEKYFMVKNYAEEKNIFNILPKGFDEIIRNADRKKEEALSKKEGMKKRAKLLDKLKSEAEVKYLGTMNGYKLYVPLNIQAACVLGDKTKWCTAATDDNFGQNMFDSYHEKDDLIVAIDEKSGEKFQLHGESGSINDDQDNPVEDDDLSEILQKYARRPMEDKISPNIKIPKLYSSKYEETASGRRFDQDSLYDIFYDYKEEIQERINSNEEALRIIMESSLVEGRRFRNREIRNVFNNLKTVERNISYRKKMVTDHPEKYGLLKYIDRKDPLAQNFIQNKINELNSLIFFKNKIRNKIDFIKNKDEKIQYQELSKIADAWIKSDIRNFDSNMLSLFNLILKSLKSHLQISQGLEKIIIRSFYPLENEYVLNFTIKNLGEFRARLSNDETYDIMRIIGLSEIVEGNHI